MQNITGFQIRAIRAALNLDIQTFQRELGVSRRSLYTLYHTPPLATAKYGKRLARRIESLITEYSIILPDQHTVSWDSHDIYLKPCILTIFQYRIALSVFLNAKVNSSTSKLFIPRNIRSATNQELLEDYVDAQLYAIRARQIFESKGLIFPNFYSVRITDIAVDNQLSTEELKLTLGQKLDSIELDDLSIEILQYLSKKNQLVIIPIVYEELVEVLKFKRDTITRKLAKLEKGGLIERTYRSIQRDSGYYRSTTCVRLKDKAYYILSKT